MTLDVGAVAHGGHCVARHEGRVYFVRHALPGERVVVDVTGIGPGGRFLRADAVQILSPSPHRRAAPCEYAGAHGCGGCDWQHTSAEYARELKAHVITEQFARLAGLDVDVRVEALPGDEDGLRWRTRVEFAVGPDGRAGLRRHRSHDVIPVDDCLIATADVMATGVLEQTWPAGGLDRVEAVDVVAPSGGPAVVVPVRPGHGGPQVVERVATTAYRGDFRLRARGFWQVHPGAAATFVEHVMHELAPQVGDQALDLYAGVGLFARPLAAAVGPTGHVVAIESDRGAVDDGIRSARATPWLRYVRGRVDRALPGVLSHGRRPDVVVLDPPRTGAGKDVMGRILRAGPRRVVYVACDPAALARDTSYAMAAGYRMTRLRAFDAFPMTHHVECLATLDKAGSGAR